MSRRKLLLFTAAIPAGVILGPDGARAAPASRGGGAPVPRLSPPLSVSFEPLEGSDAAYLPLAPRTAGGAESAKLVLRLTIINNDTRDLTVTGISFAFPGSGQPARMMQGVELVLGNGGLITPGQSRTWSNGTVELADGTEVKNQVYLTTPVPATVEIQVTTTTYPLPATFTATLAPYTVAHPFPFSVLDLRTSECLRTKGDHWANGGASGTQIYAHDIGVVGWDNGKNAWNALLPGKDGTRNEHYRAWNLPVRAVADGVVISTADGMDDNVVLGEFPDPTPNPVTGNNVWIGHPDGTRTLYAHIRKGTVAVTPGQSVRSGDVIGRLGNSGNSSSPHIHVEVRRHATGSPLRPWALAASWMIEQSACTPWDPGAAGWLRSDNRGVPNAPMLIWPSPARAGWYQPRIPEFVEVDFPPPDWWRLARNAAQAGYEPMQLDVATVNGGPVAHAVFRPTGQAATKTLLGLSAVDFGAQVATLKRDGYRPVALTSYVDSGVRFGAVLRREQGPEWTSYHGVSVAEHLSQQQVLAQQGFVPVAVAIGSEQDGVAAVYERSTASFRAVTLVSRSAFLAAVKDNERANRYLRHVSASGGRFSAVFASGVATRTMDSLDRAALIDEARARAGSGQTLQTVAGYVDGGEERFTAAWRSN